MNFNIDESIQASIVSACSSRFTVAAFRRPTNSNEPRHELYYVPMRGRTPIETDDDFIRSAYLDFCDGLSIAQRESIRLGFDVSTGTIMNRLKAMGIARQRGGVCKRLTQFTEEQHDLPEGLLISDGSLSRRRATPSFVLASIKKELVDFVQASLHPLVFSRSVVPPKDYSINGRTGRTQPAYYAFSHADRALFQYWHRWYDGETKHIPKDFHITPLTARFWYYGDGSALTMDYTASRGWKVQRTTPVILTLCTDGFTFEDCERLRTLWRSASSDIDFHIQKSALRRN